MQLENPYKVGTVHPRGRGEHGKLQRIISRHGGSSPRARGTHQGQRARGDRGRFIPAGAGNTQRVSHCVCVSSGSSPRARGTQPKRKTPCQWSRFIPAGAGNTSAIRNRERMRSVHPRGRGEHGPSERANPKAPGSSPRARGTQARRAEDVALWRFIPAGAGNTSS